MPKEKAVKSEFKTKSPKEGNYQNRTIRLVAAIDALKDVSGERFTRDLMEFLDSQSVINAYLFTGSLKIQGTIESFFKSDDPFSQDVSKEIVRATKKYFSQL